jgi:hypothetical protein
MAKCMECGYSSEQELYADGRKYPLSTDECLCKDCAHFALEEFITDAVEDLGCKFADLPFLTQKEKKDLLTHYQDIP